MGDSKHPHRDGTSPLSKGGSEGGLTGATESLHESTTDLPSHPLLRTGGEAGAPSRRQFLAGASLGLAGLLWGAKSSKGQAAPSDRITIACLGVGGMGGGHLGQLLGMSEVEVTAVCDVDQTRLDKAVGRTKGRAKGYQDYRELLADAECDAVCIASPDHWHATLAIAAMSAGRDVYVEKPLAHNVGEGQAMVLAARAHDRVVQLGTQQRAGEQWRHCVELIQSGVLGEVKHVRAFIPPSRLSRWAPDAPPPAGLDWDLWQGPAPSHDYNVNRCHGVWRYFWDYGGGQMTDWGVHHIDIVQWAMGQDRPRTIEARGTYYPGVYGQTPYELEVHYEYDGFRLDWTQLAGQRVDPEWHTNGIYFYGSDANLYIDRQGYKLWPDSFREPPLGFGDVHLPRVASHWHNFLECVRTRQRPASDVAIGHRSTTTAMLGNIAFRCGRKLHWDGDAEHFLGDPAADRLLTRTPRAPYTLG